MTARKGAQTDRRSTFAALLIAGAAGLFLAWFVWSATYASRLEAIERDGRVQLRFIAEALEKDLSRYKLLAKSLSQTDVVKRRALLDYVGANREAEALFERMAAISGAVSIAFHRVETSPSGPVSRAVADAYRGVMGGAYDIEDGGSFIVAAPVWDEAKVQGAVVLRIEAASLEWSWRSLPETVFFTGERGRIYLSSLSRMRLRTLHSAEDPLPDPRAVAEAGRTYWRLDASEWRSLGVEKDRVIAFALARPSVGMTGFALLDAAPARVAAWLAAVAAGAMVALIGLIGAFALHRRAAVAARFEDEARAKTQLEIMVADRTVELTAEIAERREAERQLRATQDELVQAGKLSALGQMAAGIAHEINQPLTAIRSFAENAAVFIERGRAAEASANLNQISSLTDRAARIIRNLRAFARKEEADTRAVDLRVVVDDALSLIEATARVRGALIDWPRPARPVDVIGGGVRLQQVVVNLLTNAMEAQTGAPRIDIRIERAAPLSRLIVRDHGGGLPEDGGARVFDPFFSTKGDRPGEGLGLGLSISYGIVKSFGGTIRAASHPEGGAVFTVELRDAEAAEAAA